MKLLRFRYLNDNDGDSSTEEDPISEKSTEDESVVSIVVDARKFGKLVVITRRENQLEESWEEITPWHRVVLMVPE